MDRAIRLVRDTYREEIKLGLRNISKIIQKETLGLGAPVTIAFRVVLAPEIRNNVYNQIDLIIENAVKYDIKQDIDILLNGNFENYLKYDLTVSYLRKNHEKAAEIKELVKDIFKHRIVLAKKLISAYKIGNFQNYDDLTRLAFPNRMDAENAINEEIDLSNKVLDIIKENPDIIYAPPIIQEFGLMIVEQLMKYGNNRKKSNLDKIYENGDK